MPKYIRRSKATGKSVDSFRDVLLKELEREGQKLLKQLTTQFARDLEQESSRVLQGLLPGSKGSAGNGGNAVPPGLEAAAHLVGSLVSYAVSRPKTTTSTHESRRSREAESRFRVSSSQAMLAAASELSKSERNL